MNQMLFVRREYMNEKYKDNFITIVFVTSEKLQIPLKISMKRKKKIVMLYEKEKNCSDVYFLVPFQFSLRNSTKLFVLF